ncbi:homocysteine S-methyltransferase family protein [Haematomicrobium sanguinis]|uniref:homocysteine S-methyltransferase family protein n=1 Tax=Haematomicrobium sanguinis TaxID=479106 RepID=UPI00047991E3|nr:homocysteine S-methyltransferase family protein [Haematomicrobium sanguinis]
MNVTAKKTLIIALVLVAALVAGTIALVAALRDNSPQVAPGKPGTTQGSDSPETSANIPNDSSATIDGSNVTWIGDSVSAGFTPDVLEERFPGINVDAKVSRSFRSLGSDISELEASGQLKKIVVIALGINGIAEPEQMQETVQQLGQDRQIILVYPNGGSGQQTIDVFNQIAAEYPDQVQTADWPAAAPKVKDFAQDGVHVGPQGAGVLADTVAPLIVTAQERLR